LFESQSIPTSDRYFLFNQVEDCRDYLFDEFKDGLYRKRKLGIILKPPRLHG
jgi:hypothetical protein